MSLHALSQVTSDLLGCMKIKRKVITEKNKIQFHTLREKRVPKQCPWGAFATNSTLFSEGFSTFFCVKTAPLCRWGAKTVLLGALNYGQPNSTPIGLLFWHPFFSECILWETEKSKWRQNQVEPFPCPQDGPLSGTVEPFFKITPLFFSVSDEYLR